ncbi:anthranilate synthase component I [Ruania suaedae]|uniref:anthranilate synthase component I n=1 Tax=Ruania suaedae TaxID=2897774 RepID=UPI001E593D46|nr:anthranilate synthase component I [Ruania suaedae]UFU04397.1 anthranilate synthase component I [Ruania suaedae]
MTATPAAPELTGPPEWGTTWPSLEQFRRMAPDRRVIPVVRRLLADDVTPVGLYRQLSSGRPGTFVLESASDGAWSRWSFIGVSARAILTERDGRAHWSGDVPVSVPTDGDVLEVLRRTLAVLHTPALPHLPPLTGGLVGSLGWDVVHHWEPTLPSVPPDELDVPDVALCLVGDMAAIDHHTGDVWLIANAINGDDSDQRVDQAHHDALARLDEMERRLVAPARSRALRLTQAEQPELQFRTTREDYAAGVQAAKEAIRDGEVFQVVLSQRLDLECPADPLDVYRVLRTINPSPYMYFLHLADADGGEFHVVGSSPETLVKVSGREVQSFPIAGSRPRGQNPAEDRAHAEELLADPKERAEHLMLVDLARNDLGRVCEAGSVAVVEFMEIKRFSHIMHMSSTVVGTVRAGTSAVDVFTATFPAGTLSGAPKPRAIALIDELEPARRGIYGGTVGYFDLAGDLDMAIAIRTALIRGGRASVQAGGGLVADSDPEAEYWETRNKAAAAVRAVQVAARVGEVE